MPPLAPRRPPRDRAPRRLAPLLAAAAALAVAPGAPAQDTPDGEARGPAEVTALRERLRRAAGTPEAAARPDAVGGPLDHCDRALAARRRRAGAGDAAGARRALAIARAHLALAERRIALVRARAALSEARGARDRAVARARELARRLGVEDVPAPPRAAGAADAP